MGKRIEVATTQSVADLESAYRRASDPVERGQRQMGWLVASGRTTTEVAATTGYSPDWIRSIIQRFNASGQVRDRRHHNPGGHAHALLDTEQQAELAQALEGPAPDGGLWSSAQVAAWISTRIGRPVQVPSFVIPSTHVSRSPETRWEVLCAMLLAVPEKAS